MARPPGTRPGERPGAREVLHPPGPGDRREARPARSPRARDPRCAHTRPDPHREGRPAHRPGRDAQGSRARPQRGRPLSMAIARTWPAFLAVALLLLPPGA